MSWDYRIVEHQTPTGVWYGIHEVYYTKRGKIQGWTADPVEVHGDTPKKLKKSVKRLRRAWSRPICCFNKIGHLEEVA